MGWAEYSYLTGQVGFYARFILSKLLLKTIFSQSFSFDPLEKPNLFKVLFVSFLVLLGLGSTVKSQCIAYPAPSPSLNTGCVGEVQTATLIVSPDITQISWSIVGGTILSGQGTPTVTVVFPNSNNCPGVLSPNRLNYNATCGMSSGGQGIIEFCIVQVNPLFLNVMGPDTVQQGDTVRYEHCDDVGPTGAVGIQSLWWEGGCGGWVFNHSSFNTGGLPPQPPCYATRGELDVVWSTSGTKQLKGLMEMSNNYFSCYDTAYKTVEVLPVPNLPPFLLGNDTTLSYGDSLLLMVPQFYGNPTWQDGTIGNQYWVKCPGTYFLSVGPPGCALTDTIVIDPDSTPFPQILLPEDTTLCLNSNHFLSPIGGFSSYLWSTGASSDSIIVNVASEYWVQGTDSLGCISTDTFTLDIDPLSYSLVALPTCQNFPNGMVSLDSLVGTAPITFSLNGNPFSANSTFTQLSVGNYTYTVRDSLGCSSTDSFSIEMDTVLAIGQTTPPCQSGTGEVIIQPTSGVPSFSFSMDGTNFQSSGQFTGLVTGSYLFWVEDAIGCKYLGTFDIQPHLSSLPNDAFICEADSITLSGTPDPLNQVTWSTGAISQSITVSNAGQYIATIIDTAGNVCLDTTAVILDQVLVNSQLVQNTCVADSTGSGILNPISGFPPFSYYFSGSLQPSGLVTGLSPGIYPYTVFDSLGCYGTGFYTQSSYPVPVLTLNVAPSSNQNGSIQVLVANGSPPFQYSLDGVLFQGSNTFSNLPPGQFTVYVTDANGCIYSQPATVPVVLYVEGPDQQPFQVYPNPSSGGVKIKFDASISDCRVVVYNHVGKRVTTYSGEGDLIEFDLGNIASGLYFLEIRLGNESFLESVLLETD